MHKANNPKMTYSNQHITHRLTHIMQLLGIIICIIIILDLFSFFDPYSDSMWMFWLPLLCIIITIIFGRFEHVELEITEDTSTIKFKRLSITGFVRRKIAIHNEHIQKVTLHKGFFGIGSSLSFRVNTHKGIAAYPSIGMAAMSRTDREKIYTTLAHFAKKNRLKNADNSSKL